MKKLSPVALIVMFAVACVLTFFIVHTLNQQAATQKELDDLRKSLAANAPAPVPPAPSVMAPPPEPPQGGSILAREKATRDYVTEGFRLLDTRKPAEVRQAAAIFQEGLDKVDASNPDLLNGLGRAQLLLGQPEDALRTFQRARSVKPEHSEFTSGQAWALWNLHRYGEAKAAFEEALKSDPESIDAWSALAWIYLSQGDDALSQRGFRIHIRREPDRLQWATGLTMARAGNHNLSQIRAQFPSLPEPGAFLAMTIPHE